MATQAWKLRLRDMKIKIKACMGFAFLQAGDSGYVLQRVEASAISPSSSLLRPSFPIPRNFCLPFFPACLWNQLSLPTTFFYPSILFRSIPSCLDLSMHDVFICYLRMNVLLFSWSRLWSPIFGYPRVVRFIFMSLVLICNENWFFIQCC